MERISDFEDAIVKEVDRFAMRFDLGGGKWVEGRESVRGVGKGGELEEK